MRVEFLAERLPLSVRDSDLHLGGGASSRSGHEELGSRGDRRRFMRSTSAGEGASMHVCQVHTSLPLLQLCMKLM